MDLTIQLAIVGLVVGAAYALAALGLLVTFKGSGVLNIAHGAVGMVGTYVYANWTLDGKPAAVGLVLGVATSATVGVLVHLLVIRPMRGAPFATQVVATFGVLILLRGLAELRWPPVPTRVPSIFPSGLVDLPGGHTISRAGLATIAVAVILAIGLAVAFRATTIGRAVEAAAIDERAALRLGYRVEWLGALAWGVGGGLAGVAGILVAPTMGLDQTNLTLLVFAALAGAMMGGFKRIGVTVLTSFLIGAAESVIVGRVSAPGWKESVPFFVIVAVLLVRGRAVPTRESIVRRALPAAPRPTWSWRAVGLAGAAAVVAVVTLNPFWASVVVLGLGYAIVGLSVVVVTGYLGELTLAQWAIAGFGAFTAGWLAVRHGWPMPAAMAGATALGFPLGVAIGVPAIRVRGINLAVVTLGAAVAIRGLHLARNWTLGLQLPAPSIAGRRLDERGQLVVALMLTALAALAVWTLRRSPFGQRLVAIRASERAATAAGIDVRFHRLVAFGISASLAALGGSVWAYGVGRIGPDSFPALQGVLVAAWVFVAGVGVISGGIVAGLLLGLGPQLFTDQLDLSSSWFGVLGGLCLIVVLRIRPDGAFARRRGTRPRVVDAVPRQRRQVERAGSRSFAEANG